MKIKTYASFVRFSHSVFALPFALAGALLAAQHAPVTWASVGWILGAPPPSRRHSIPRRGPVRPCRLTIADSRFASSFRM